MGKHKFSSKSLVKIYMRFLVPTDCFHFNKWRRLVHCIMNKCKKAMNPSDFEAKYLQTDAYFQLDFQMLHSPPNN